ncbi:hypothetical protein ACP70R_021739 [Stipagrostis hirtigluma subsp. patula]
MRRPLGRNMGGENGNHRDKGYYPVSTGAYGAYSPPVAYPYNYQPQGPGYLPPSGSYVYPPSGCPPHGHSVYPPSTYPHGNPYAPQYHGHGYDNTGAMLAGGAAAAAAAYGVRHLTHGHHYHGYHSGHYGRLNHHHHHGHYGKFKHGKFGKHRFGGKHGFFGGKFKKWK